MLCPFNVLVTSTAKASASRIWRYSASQLEQLKAGVWRLAFGVWRSAFGFGKNQIKLQILFISIATRTQMIANLGSATESTVWHEPQEQKLFDQKSRKFGKVFFGLGGKV